MLCFLKKKVVFFIQKYKLITEKSAKLSQNVFNVIPYQYYQWCIIKKLSIFKLEKLTIKILSYSYKTKQISKVKVKKTKLIEF